MKRRDTKALILQAAPPKEALELLLRRAGCIWEWQGDDDELEFSVSKATTDWLRSQIAVLLGNMDYKYQKVRDTVGAETWHYWFYVEALP